MVGRAKNDGRPFQGGAQPVQERPQEVPTRGQSVLQMVVFGIAVLVLVAALAWMLVPLAG